MRKKFSWGVPGKRFNVYDRTNDLKPQPLNKNPFDSWDAKKSNFQRIDLVPQIVVGGGGPYNATPEPTPTPSVTPTNTVTPSVTPTNTVTPSVTPTNTVTPTTSVTPSITPSPSVTPSVSISPSVTPTMTLTPTPSSTSVLANCYWSAQTGTWEFTTQDWDGCESPPSPSQTPTNTPTPSVTPSSPPVPGLVEANLYLSAVTFAGGTGITSTESGATQTLFSELFTNNLWDKMIAFYPMLGGIAASCKFNGKSPYDSNSDYRLTFNGGWTFNSSGTTGNGTNAYANSYMGSNEEPNLRTLGFYVQIVNAQGSDIGNTTSYLASRENFGTRALFQFGGGGTAQATDSDSQGIYIGRRFNNGNTIWENGTQIGVFNGGSNAWGTNELYFAAQNNSGVAEDFTNNRFGFLFMSEELTSSETITLTNIINTFATTIGRNTY